MLQPLLYIADWSKMNLDLYASGTAQLLCPTPQPHRASCLNLPSTLFSIVDPGMMVPAAGLWLNVGIVMSVNDVTVNTYLPTAPFEPTRGLSAPGPSLHLGENAVGINNKVALQVAAPLG